MLVGLMCIRANLRTFRSCLYFKKATRLQRLGNARDAKEVYIKAISLNKTDPQIYYKLGALYAGEKKWNLAEKAYRDRKSTRLNSSHIPLSRMPSSA